MNYNRYQRVPVVDLPDRKWPGQEIQKAPVWCSVDLRDGNQALIDPMDVEEKIEFYKMLLKIGFKEIEIGFPSASQIEFDFLRELVNRNLIPEDVVLQVLVQCREHLIDRTFEAIQGIPNVIVHIYNSTSTLQRDVVFHMNTDEIRQIAVDGTRMVRERAEKFWGNIILEYSPESFTGTELPFALEICEAVLKEWGASKEKKVIINLPSTVENTTPNVYADRIEWMGRQFSDRDAVILSVHPHNDRGTGVASAELALLAGCDRVEGTLFGNGERTGNVDILNIAYNMFSQGIAPGLELENLAEIMDVYERCTKMNVPMRHPYAGKLVFTAFSGSHQDAINKGVQALHQRTDGIWEVPYLPIDPADLGREYEPIVRINSQSGKGGVAFVMDTCYGFKLPKGMHKEFADVIQKIAEQIGEVSPAQIMEQFSKCYLEQKQPLHFIKCRVEDGTDSALGLDTAVTVNYEDDGAPKVFSAEGNGPIDAVQQGLQNELGLSFSVLDYSEHALREGANAQAAAYIHVMDQETGVSTFGVGVSSNITRASVRGIFSAVNRLLELRSSK